MVDYQAQHPIPQEVTSYQFRLVGDMTLKQFFQVAAGALIALLIYSSGLIGFIKWPLVAISFLLGIAFAFLPFEDRPLEKWFVLFFKSIYAPTLFSWAKGPKVNYFSQDTTAQEAPAVEQSTPVQMPAAQTAPVTDQIQTGPAPVGIHKETTEALSGLEESEAALLANISQHMNTQPGEPLPVAPEVHTPLTNELEATNTAQQVNSVQALQEQEPVVIQQRTSYQPPSADAAPQEQVHTITQRIQPVSNDSVSKYTDSEPEDDGPEPPMRANIIVGKVIGPEKEPLDAAILEVRDAEGRPARAFRSNSMGHFSIVTPLMDGMYEITTEKEGYVFDTVRFEAKGDIIDPMTIQAKEKLTH